VTEAFGDEERAAMRATIAEEKARRAGADMEAACLAAIAEMSGTDRKLAEIIHRLVKENTALAPRTWYGMPAYADAEGRVVTFFQSAAKFKVRYATLGFQAPARLDAGNFWPTSYAVVDLDEADQKAIVELLKRAVN
jgi:uncharacterized protein YdhG (YjbR/CyaY superfamily)